MNKTQTIEAANIMLAWARDGKEIESSLRENEWRVTEEPSWNWNAINYRVKPEKKILGVELAYYINKGDE